MSTERTEKRREYERKYRAEHREQIRGYARNYRERHPERVREQHAKFRDHHPEVVRAWGRGYWDRNRTAILTRRRAEYDQTRDQRNALARKRHAELRDIVIAGYGGRCACCAEAIPTFLDLDHVNNDGCAERKKFGKNTSRQYRLVIKQGFPNCYQLLCRNCNWGKRIHGICPHKL